eukprot:COSAG06_NODE_166_length_21548_cov_13.568651_5_plen_259_part_00
MSIPGGATNASTACVEAELDTEMMLAAVGGGGGVARSVVGVNNGSSFLEWALDWFAEDSEAGSPDIATVSWGGGEGKGAAPTNSSNQMRLNVELQKLGVRGKAVFWAAGDAGTGGAVKNVNSTSAFHCGYSDADPEGASKGFMPGFPATSPFVTACGGTEVGPRGGAVGAAAAAPICAALERAGFSSGCASGARQQQWQQRQQQRQQQRGPHANSSVLNAIEVATSLNVSVRQTPSLSHLDISTLFLPRHARDKYSKS